MRSSWERLRFRSYCWFQPDCYYAACWRLRDLPLGFVPHNVVTTAVFLPQIGRWHGGSNRQVCGQRHRAGFLRSTAGAAGSNLLVSTPRPSPVFIPLSPNFQAGGSFDIIGRPKDPANKTTGAIRAVSPSLYSTLGIRLLQGRLFNESDGPRAPAAAVVNQAFALKVFSRSESSGSAAEDQRERAARCSHHHRCGREHSSDGNVART